jgi:predicted MarR family transcription regulator
MFTSWSLRGPPAIQKQKTDPTTKTILHHINNHNNNKKVNEGICASWKKTDREAQFRYEILKHRKHSFV